MKVMDIAKPASSSDWEQMVDIWAKCFGREYQKIFLLPPDRLKGLIYQLNKDSDVWMAKRGDSVIGVLNLSHPKHKERGFIEKGRNIKKNVPLGSMLHSALFLLNPKLHFRNSLNVDQIAVEPHHRGDGVGSKFLDFSKEYADSLGLGMLSLMVDIDNPAVALYKRKGFLIHKTVCRWPIHQTLGYKGLHIMVCKV